MEMGASAPPLQPLLRRPAAPMSGHLFTRRSNPEPRSPSCVAIIPSARSYGIRGRGGRFPVFAEGEGNGLGKEEAQPKGEEPAIGEGEASKMPASGGGAGGQEPPRRRAVSAGIRWGELLLDPDPDNVLAVGLTGLLAWASVQVLWQLFFISLAILLAALKYSFIAALLLFILITLL